MTPERAAPEAGARRAKWILVVEDDEDNRELMIEILEHAGYVVRGVGDGAAALDILQADKPCLVLADVIMKDMDGAELFAHARRLLELAVPPFVFLTGAHPSRLNDIDATILSKPLDFDRLLGVVEDHCGPT